MSREDFTRDLTNLINKHSLENVSDTPDWILAEYLVKCLDNYHEIDTAKKKWFQNDDAKVDDDQPHNLNAPFGW